MQHNQQWRPGHVVITGASSGLGAGLARMLASRADRLTLIARRSDLLDAVASSCAAHDIDVQTHAVDVRDRNAMAAVIDQAHRAAPLGLVIANAGIGGGPGITQDDIYAVNMDGVRHTVEPALSLMIEQAHGQIALMSSLAGFRGFPTAPAYSASKNFVRAYGEGLQGKHRRDGVDISVICPGFVDTPMTKQNPFKMPLLMDSDKACQIMINGLAKRKARIAFPWPTYMFSALLPLLPSALVERMLQGQPGKE